MTKHVVLRRDSVKDPLLVQKLTDQVMKNIKRNSDDDFEEVSGVKYRASKTGKKRPIKPKPKVKRVSFEDVAEEILLKRKSLWQKLADSDE